MAIEYRLIDYNDPRAIEIRALMDTEMEALYEGFDHHLTDDQRAQMARSFVIQPKLMLATLGAFDGEKLVGHAALRASTHPDGTDALEVKRVIVLKEYRGRGISRRIMAELEDLALKRGVHSLVLQTGNRQLEAIALYEKIGYLRIGAYGLYPDVPGFLFYGKTV